MVNLALITSLHQMQLVKSLYECDYKAYLNAMVLVEPILQADRYLYPHLAYWMRELHILAYKQFLDSYQSVTLQAMAALRSDDGMIALCIEKVFDCLNGTFIAKLCRIPVDREPIATQQPRATEQLSVCARARALVVGTLATPP